MLAPCLLLSFPIPQASNITKCDNLSRHTSLGYRVDSPSTIAPCHLTNHCLTAWQQRESGHARYYGPIISSLHEYLLSVGKVSLVEPRCLESTLEPLIEADSLFSNSLFPCKQNMPHSGASISSQSVEMPWTGSFRPPERPCVSTGTKQSLLWGHAVIADGPF